MNLHPVLVSACRDQIVGGLAAQPRQVAREIRGAEAAAVMDWDPYSDVRKVLVDVRKDINAVRRFPE